MKMNLGSKVLRAVSKSHAGKRLDEAHRHLRGATDLVFSDASALEARASSIAASSGR